MGKDLIRTLYFKDWVRIPVKFLISFWIMKIGYDYYEYRSAWRSKGPCPRFATFNQHSPLNPRLPVPYPHYQNYQQFKNIKRYYSIHNNMQKLYITANDRSFLYFDAPCRESDNAIDRFFLRGKEHSTSEKGKFYFLNEFAQKEGEVPHGVYQEIRNLRKDQLEVEANIVPKL